MTDCTIQGTPDAACLRALKLRVYYTFGKCTVGGAYLCPIWIIIEDNVGNDNGLGVYL